MSFDPSCGLQPDVQMQQQQQQLAAMAQTQFVVGPNGQIMQVATNPLPNQTAIVQNPNGTTQVITLPSPVNNQQAALFQQQMLATAQQQQNQLLQVQLANQGNMALQNMGIAPMQQIVQYAGGNVVMTSPQPPQPQIVQGPNGQLFAITQSQPTVAPLNYGMPPTVVSVMSPTGQAIQCVQIATPQGIQLIPTNSLLAQPSVATSQVVVQQQVPTISEQSTRTPSNISHSQSSHSSANLPQTSDATRLHVQQIIQQQQQAILQQQIQKQQIHQQLPTKKAISENHSPKPPQDLIAHQTKTYQVDEESSCSSQGTSHNVSSTTTTKLREITPKPAQLQSSQHVITTDDVKYIRVTSDGILVESHMTSSSTSMSPPIVATSPGLSQEPESTTQMSSGSSTLGSKNLELIQVTIIKIFYFQNHQSLKQYVTQTRRSLME